VLGALAGGDQAGVHRGLVEVLFHDRLAFFDDSGDAVAVFAATFSSRLSNTCSSRSTCPGFFESAIRKLRRSCGFDDAFASFVSAFRQLLFGVVESRSSSMNASWSVPASAIVCLLWCSSSTAGRTRGGSVSLAEFRAGYASLVS
jgi:hypothetical protein